MYEFRFEVWEITEENQKMIGSDNVNIKANDLKTALAKAWEKKSNDGSLVNHYFYRMALR